MERSAVLFVRRKKSEQDGWLWNAKSSEWNTVVIVNISSAARRPFTASTYQWKAFNGSWAKSPQGNIYFIWIDIDLQETHFHVCIDDMMFFLNKKRNKEDFWSVVEVQPIAGILFNRVSLYTLRDRGNIYPYFRQFTKFKQTVKNILFSKVHVICQRVFAYFKSDFFLGTYPLFLSVLH